MAGAQDQPSTLGGTWGSQDHGDVWVTVIREGCRGLNTAQLLVLSLLSVPCAELCLFLGGGGMSGRAPAVQVAHTEQATLACPGLSSHCSGAGTRSHRPQRPRLPQCVPGAHTLALCLPTSLPPASFSQSSHPHSCLQPQDTPLSEFSVQGAS